MGNTAGTVVDSELSLRFENYGNPRRQVQLANGHELGINREQRIEAGDAFDSEWAQPDVSWPRQRHIGMSSGASGAPLRQVLCSAGSVAGGGTPHYLVLFSGRIRYRDDIGVVREMAFLRQLEYGSHRFVPWGDPQLEYSDTNP
jgi:hypothetical protein